MDDLLRSFAADLVDNIADALAAGSAVIQEDRFGDAVDAALEVMENWGIDSDSFTEEAE